MTKPTGGAGARPLSRRQFAAAAGLSRHQEKQAVRVARVPAEEFEALVESDQPPTITALAARGTQRSGSPPKTPAVLTCDESRLVLGFLGLPKPRQSVVLTWLRNQQREGRRT